MTVRFPAGCEPLAAATAGRWRPLSRHAPGEDDQTATEVPLAAGPAGDLLELLYTVPAPPWPLGSLELPAPRLPLVPPELRRVWRKGDRIELMLPFTLRSVPIDARHPDTVAIMHGPLMLAAVNPPENLSATAEALRRMTGVSAGLSEFDLASGGGKVRLRPWYSVQRQPYSVYFN